MSLGVAITGVGCVTPLGAGAEASWSALLDGACGLGARTGEEHDALPSRVAGEVHGELDVE